MARGYPEPKEQEAPPPGEVVAADTCPICKRRPCAPESRYCAPCGAILRGDATKP